MKLFTSTEVSTNKQFEATKEENRLRDITKLLERRKQELKDLEIDFEFTVGEQVKTWDAIKLERNTEIAELEAKIAVLEERRRQNLHPLELKSEDLDRLQKKLNKKDSLLNKKLEDADEKLDTLENKLTELGDREQVLDTQLKMHTKAQQGIDSQRAQVALQAHELSESMDKSYKEDRIRKNELKRLESSIELREKAITYRLGEIEQKENSFASREKALKDKYDTLERTAKKLGIVV